MTDEFAELVKKNMLHRFLFLGIERASFKKGTTTFSGYAIRIRDKDSLLFISDIEDYSFTQLILYLEVLTLEIDVSG